MSKIDEKLNNLLNNRKRDNLTPNSDYIESIKKLFGYKDLKPLEERKIDFIETVRPYVEEMGKEEANRFVKYWTATSGKKGRLMAFEKEKSWNLKARISTWMRNQKSWSISAQLRKGKKDYE